MYYSDYHLHSQLSSDSHTTLDQICQAAVERGMREICLTDHWNLVDQEANILPIAYDWEKTRQLILETRDKYFGKLDVRMGIELGNAPLNLHGVAENLPLGKLDFVIGSVHNNSPELGSRGAYTLARAATTQEGCARIASDYMDVMKAVVRDDNYDVLGHIIYPFRYFPSRFDVSIQNYWDHVEEIFEIIIAKGKGIEVNTSQGTTISDWKPLLERYRQMGGEILTTGSDAHFTDKVGLGIQEATQLISDCGFRYVSTFRQRVPHFVKIG